MRFRWLKESAVYQICITLIGQADLAYPVRCEGLRLRLMEKAFDLAPGPD
jgi:hypothetical protein